jgi:hypothetical protein
MLTLGSDPESFLMEKDGSTLVPPIYLQNNCGLSSIGGTKKHPIFLQTKNVNIIADGAAFEFNPRPSTTPEEFYSRIGEMKDGLNELGNKFNLIPAFLPTVNFNVERFFLNDKLTKEEKMAVIFGCDPDRRAFNSYYVSEILDVYEHKFRYGGGHIHISYPEKNELIKDEPVPIVLSLMLYLGTYCVINSPFLKEDRQRCFYYGIPDRYRIQKYSDEINGIEFRPPSNSWMSWSKEKFNDLFFVIEKAIESVENKKIGKLIKKYGDHAYNSISNYDVESCKDILNNII